MRGERSKAASLVLISGFVLSPGIPVAQADGLPLMDVRTPFDPVFVGSYDTSGYAWDVAVLGRYAYVVDGNSGLLVFDVLYPATPDLRGTYNTAGLARGAAVAGVYAYVADSGPGLQVIDISDPSHPQRVGGCDTPGNALDVAVAGTYAYVADEEAGLQVINISVPSNPQVCGSYDTSYAEAVAVSGHYAYVADGYAGLHLFDVSAPCSPQWKDTYNTTGYASGVFVSGLYAYVADYEAGLHIIYVDFADPLHPDLKRIGGFNTGGWAKGVAVVGGFAYVADALGGLVVIDIVPRTTSGWAGWYNTSGYAQSVTIWGQNAYVGDGDGGLVILRVPLDCNTNGMLDEQDVAQGTSEDCNANSTPDECDLSAGTSPDANEDDIPDECQDCNTNGIVDALDIAGGTSTDCNANLVPDECDLGAGTSLDVNTNGILDECEFDCLGPEFARLLASDGAGGDGFGSVAAFSGDVVLIGAPFDDDLGNDSGAAYVFRYDGVTWVQEAKFTASDGAAGDYFGGAVALSDTVAVIGAYGDDLPGKLDAGSAYVSRYNGLNWAQEAKLTASDAAASDNFGFSVAVAGDYALIGAYGDDYPGKADAGSAYVFRYGGVAWTAQAKLTPTDSAAGDRFGRSVALVGVIGVIGSPYDDDACPGNPFCDSGSAYVFGYTGAVWVQQAKLTAPDAAAGDTFGHAVTAFGSTVAVGAPNRDDACPGDPNCNSGAAYLFRYNTPAWVSERKLTPSEGAIGDQFGWSLGLFETTAVIAAQGDEAHRGSAYVFRYDAPAWLEKAKLIVSDGVESDNFGYAVGLAGDNAVVGAPYDDDLGTDSGSAYIFRGLGDCNTNGVPDICDVADGPNSDCNTNGLPDECDIAGGTSLDGNPHDGIPDECGCVIAQLTSSLPADQSSLWRSAKNCFKLSFDCDITAPLPGQILLNPLLDGGLFGPDLSGSFTFTVENDGQGKPRVLRLNETGTVLTHRTWIGVRNLGNWVKALPFEVQYVVMICDVNQDKKVLANDLSVIFPKIPTSNTPCEERADVNGDNKVLANDLSVCFPRIPSPTTPKPSGH